MDKSDSLFMISHKMTHKNDSYLKKTRAYAVQSAATNITSITSAIWLLVNHC